ncbi:hypothetical protein GCM10023223_29410 [Stackebrandtia albiflava]
MWWGEVGGTEVGRVLAAVAAYVFLLDLCVESAHHLTVEGFQAKLRGHGFSMPPVPVTVVARGGPVVTGVAVPVSPGGVTWPFGQTNSPESPGRNLMLIDLAAGMLSGDSMLAATLRQTR